MLTSHPAISVAPESQSLVALLRHFPTTAPLTAGQAQTAQRIIREDSKLNGWKLDVTPYLETAQNYAAGVTLREIISDQLRFYRDQVAPEAHIAGYKKGNMTEQATLLHTLLPEAKFIFIYRDARAAAASMIKNLPDYDATRAARKWLQRVWAAQYFTRAQHFTRQHPAALLAVRYEALVETPEATLRELCAFLGVPYDPQLLAYYQENRQGERLISGHEAIHRHTSEPISTRHAEKWKAQLSAREVAIIEALTGPELRAYGYPPAHAARLPLRERLRCLWLRRQELRALRQRQRDYRAGKPLLP